MRNYSANLYRKFRTRTMNTLNGDDFYEYFMKVVESGPRFYGQKNMALVKTIDEKWVNAIYDCLIPLENIIKKPRKFIERQENIVPIELAKKVGSDAVKHLSSHTHFISRIDRNGDVIPNKILNVYNDDSYHIYENRFVYTLLGRITQFLDRRYEALFGTTGDEFESVLKVNSEFNDNDEKIEYNLVLKIHQGQNYLDNNSNDPLVYDNIEHIRLMLNGFKRSEFYQKMIGCTQVRSPISKTNLIMKEPNFKMCYKLWQFMDRYTDVGYSIEKREYESEFDEQYLDEINTLTLFQYLILKNNLESEHNKPIDIRDFKKKRTIKPKFVSTILEEFVYDYDIPEVELRQIFNEEISKAYKKKIGNEDEIREALERALGKEIDKKEKSKREEEIRAALEYALGIANTKRDKIVREAEIKDALSRALGIAIENLEAMKAEEKEAGLESVKLQKFKKRDLSNMESVLAEARSRRARGEYEIDVPKIVVTDDEDFGEEFDKFLLNKELDSFDELEDKNESYHHASAIISDEEAIAESIDETFGLGDEIAAYSDGVDNSSIDDESSLELEEFGDDFASYDSQSGSADDESDTDSYQDDEEYSSDDFTELDSEYDDEAADEYIDEYKDE